MDAPSGNWTETQPETCVAWSVTGCFAPASDTLQPTAALLGLAKAGANVTSIVGVTRPAPASCANASRAFRSELWYSLVMTCPSAAVGILANSNCRLTGG